MVVRPVEGWVWGKAGRDQRGLLALSQRAWPPFRDGATSEQKARGSASSCIGRDPGDDGSASLVLLLTLYRPGGEAPLELGSRILQ